MRAWLDIPDTQRQSDQDDSTDTEDDSKGSAGGAAVLEATDISERVEEQERGQRRSFLPWSGGGGGVSNRRLVLGVDRLDYVKGLPEKVINGSLSTDHYQRIIINGS